MAATIVSIVVVVLAGILNWYSHATYEPGYGFSEYGAYSDMAGVGDPIYIVIAVVSCAPRYSVWTDDRSTGSWFRVHG